MGSMNARFLALPLALVAGTLAHSPNATPTAATCTQGKLDTRAKSCGECHKAIYKEWKESVHAHSWTDEIYQAWAAKKKKPKSCHRCHAPTPVIAVAPKRPKMRKNNLDEGVTCATCHVHEGKVHGPWGAKTDAHTSVQSDLFTGSGVPLCQSCHRITPKPVISLGVDFERAGLEAKGKSCKKCHMPEIERHIAVDPKTGKPSGPKRMTHRHVFVGGSSPEMMAKAFEFHTSEKDGQVTMRLENLAGHRLPGLTLRSFSVEFALLGEGGKVLGSSVSKITAKEPLKLGTSLSTTLAKAAGTKHTRVRVNHFFARLKKDKPKDMGVVFEATK